MSLTSFTPREAGLDLWTWYSLYWTVSPYCAPCFLHDYLRMQSMHVHATCHLWVISPTSPWPLTSALSSSSQPSPSNKRAGRGRMPLQRIWPQTGRRRQAQTCLVKHFSFFIRGVKSGCSTHWSFEFHCCGKHARDTNVNFPKASGLTDSH